MTAATASRRLRRLARKHVGAANDTGREPALVYFRVAAAMVPNLYGLAALADPIADAVAAGKDPVTIAVAAVDMACNAAPAGAVLRGDQIDRLFATGRNSAFASLLLPRRSAPGELPVALDTQSYLGADIDLSLSLTDALAAATRTVADQVGTALCGAVLIVRACCAEGEDDAAIAAARRRVGRVISGEL